MSEQGIDDYGLAKRKAAERLGATDIAVLPKNTEIEAALAAHHRLFEAHTHSSTLSALRRTALQAMRLLQRFRAAPGRAGAERHCVGAFGSESASVRGRRRTGGAASDGARHSASRSPSAACATSRTGWSRIRSCTSSRAIGQSTRWCFRSTASGSRRRARSMAGRCAARTRRKWNRCSSEARCRLSRRIERRQLERLTSAAA